MPRTFPSRIAGYLTTTFKRPDDLSQAVLFSCPGYVMGFLELYDGLPDELIRLSEDDYASLVVSVATIRFGLDKFRHTNDADSLIPVVRALKDAWSKIAALKDEVPADTHDLSFIADLALQEMIGLDIAAVSTDLQNGEWKGATIIAGSCYEALLLYGLQVTEGKKPGSISSSVVSVFASRRSPNVTDLTDRSWDLYSYTEVAAHVGIIRPETRCELDIARDYRNLIHPAKSVREQVRCDRGTAYVAVGALEHLVSDLKKFL